MEKTFTLVYSIHNLASKTYHHISKTDDLDGRDEYSDVYEALDKFKLMDVRQEVVDSILEFADKI